MISLFEGVENILEKEENADHQHFLLFPQSFRKAFFPGVFKTLDCFGKGKGLFRSII